MTRQISTNWAVPNPKTLLTTRFLSIDGGTIAYDDTEGDGPLILAMPGMGDLRSEYRHIRPALQQAGYRIVTMDIRGFGETSAYWNDYSAHAVASDALALMGHLGAGSAILFGNSFAAGAALWAAHDAPARVRGAVLLGPLVRDQKTSLFAKIALAVGFAGPWRVRFWTTYWDSLFPSRKPDDHEEAKTALGRNLREPGRMDALRKMVSLSKADTAAILANNTVKTLIVMGTRDPDFPNATAEADWLATILRGERVLVEGSGHYPHTEMSEVVAPEVRSFIEQLGSPAAPI